MSSAASGATGAVSLPAASVVGIQALNIRAVSTTAADATTLAATNFSGVTAINSTRSTSAVTVTDVANTTSIGIVGNGVLTNGATTATYVSTATAPVLNIRGGTIGSGAVSITAAGATSFVINSSEGLVSSTDATGLNTIGTLAAPGGSTSTMTVNASSSLTTGAITTSVQTIDINGSAKVVTLGAITDANLTTIDASGMTAGGVTVTLLPAVTSFIGGAGVDTVTTVSTLDADSVINGGGGTGDILVVADTTSISSLELGSRFSNFEVLRNTTSGSINAANVTGITSVQIGAAGGGFIGLTAQQAAAVQARVDTSAVTLALADASGTSDALTLTLGTGTTTSAAANTGIITANGFETINLIAKPGSTLAAGAAGQTSTITGAIVGTSLKAVNLSGTAITLTDIASTNAVTWNGSALTGNGTTSTTAVQGLSVAGSAKSGSVITGSSLRDSFTIGAVGSTYNGGDGNDTFTSSIAVAAGSTLIGGNGTDKLVLSNAGTIGDATFAKVTGFETIELAAGTTLTSGGFFNTAFGASGETTVVGSTGTNALDFSTVTATLTVTAGNGTNTITGSSTAINTITGGTLVDVITGGSAADTLSGGTGDDYLVGLLGLDTMSGDAGSDFLRGSTQGAVAESATGSSDVDIMFGGAVSVLNSATNIYAESVDGTMGSALNSSFATVYAPWSTTYAAFVAANIYEGRGGNDILVATDQKDIFVYKTFSQNILNANNPANPTLSAQNYLGTDTIQNFKVGTDFLAVAMDIGGADYTFVSGTSSSGSGSQQYLKASSNGWSIAASTATSVTLTFDASENTADSGLGTLGDFSITLVGLQNFTAGVTTVDDFFMASTAAT